MARLAMEHGVNTNLLFKWRRALRAGEYDPVGLLPVTVEAPAPQTERPTPPAAPTSVDRHCCDGRNRDQYR
jgi:transposase